ncbi:MAG: 4Fe-4S dicluster domain-containing protein [Solirubrobacteraceae bacterium]
MRRHRTSSSWKEPRRETRRARIDPHFADEIEAIPGGNRLRECIQCGTCSAVCPLSAYMDYTPRRLIAMTRAGMKDEVLNSFSIWACAGCYACTTACPKQIPITDMMYALKRTAIREGVHPRRFATPILAREFIRSVDRYGRNTESRLAINLYLKTRPSLLLADAPLPQRLHRKGRMGLRRQSIRQRAQLRTMLRAVEGAPRSAATGGSAATAGPNSEGAP